MDKKVIYIILIVLVIGVLLLANITGSSKNLSPEKVEDLADVKNRIDYNEEINYDSKLIYGINETYLDQNYAITLKKVEYVDNLVKYSFIFENTTDNEQNFPLNTMVCEINQQGVENINNSVVLIKKGDKKEILFECNGTEEDDINVVYHGKLFDGRDIDIRFKRK